jgi:drug/metabolite transporter (DMT)-like permease
VTSPSQPEEAGDLIGGAGDEPANADTDPKSPAGASSAGPGRGVALCAVAALLFGATTPFVSGLADGTASPVLAGLLYVGAALAVAPFAARRRVHRTALRRGLGRLAWAVGAGGMLGPLLLVAGLARTSAATASLLLNLELVATTVLAAVLFREHIGRRVGAGTVAVVAAGVVLVWTDAPEPRLGALLIVGACFCWGLDNCVTADLDEIAPEHITLAKGVIAGGTNLALGAALGASMPAFDVVLGALVVGALGYGASITLWVAGAREIGAARGQLVFASAPFVGVVIAWVAFGDPVRTAEMVALVLAGFGVSRVLGSQHLHDHHHDAQEHDHEHIHNDGHHDHGASDDRSDVRHSHGHRHERVVHAHPHVPDLHHRHDHGD